MLYHSLPTAIQTCFICCPLALDTQPHQSPPLLCSDKIASLCLSHSICPSFAYEPTATTKSSDFQTWLLIRITWATFKIINSQDSSPEILIKLNLSSLFSTYQYRVLYKIFNYVNIAVCNTHIFFPAFFWCL